MEREKGWRERIWRERKRESEDGERQAGTCAVVRGGR